MKMLVHDLLDRSLYIPFSHESMQEVVAILSTCLNYYLATNCLRFLSVVLRNYIIVVSESLVQFSGFSEFGGENTQISPEFGANRANT